MREIPVVEHEMPLVKIVRVHEYGAPENMVLDELPTPVPGPGEVLVRVAAAGVNFYDTQQRSGMFKRGLPLALGTEGAGTVAAVGTGANEWKPGDRVAWHHGPGSYATHTLVAADKLVELPATLGFEDAAAVLFQGMTAHHLACSTYPLGEGDVALVHSAAGGVGGLLCQIAKRRGARVIAAVSTDAKAEVARASGAERVVIYGRDDIVAEVKAFSGGAGANVVYDAVGLATFESSLDALRPRGYLVIYGEASGLVPPLDVRTLSSKGSLYVTRTSLASYAATRPEFLQRAQAVLGWVADGSLRPRIFRVYPLAEAAAAHRVLESRETIGKVVLRPPD
jgi:NADPH:quinone reductase